MDLEAYCLPDSAWRRALTKTLRIMRLTAILLLAACLELSAGAYSQQQISLSIKNAPLEKVFKEIEKQTGYLFFYSREQMQQAAPVSLEIRNVSLEEVLDQCFRDQPFTYETINKTVVVKAKEPAATLKEISGLVVDENNIPLNGANVIFKKTKRGTITDAKGKFVLKGEITEQTVLVVSFIGYNKQEVTIGSSNPLVIKLKVATSELDVQVVQAYGTTSQRFATGDIGVVTAKDIEKQPVMNPLMALQGRVAGLDIQQNNGYASAPVKAEIRGRTGVDDTQTNEPLYIVDGVPLTVVNVGGQSTYGMSSGFIQNGYMTGPAGGQSPLFSISPSDIESISVLKDADATSIYGSRGANGVILITTKKGQSGKTQFNAHIDEGINRVTRFWKMLNTPQYLAMRREAFKNDGIEPDLGNALDLLAWDTTRYTDWQKALYGRTGRVINSNMSVSGGNAYTTFRVAGEYSHAQSITTVSGADQRASVSLNLTHTSLNRLFTMSLTSSYSFTRSDMRDIGGRVNYAPNAPPIFDQTGKLEWDEWRPYGGNPFTILLQPYTSKANFLNSNLNLKYQPVRGLSVMVNLGYNTSQTNQVSLTTISSQDPISQPTGTAQFGINTNKNWIVEPQISYELQVGEGKLSFLAGGSVQQNTTDGVFMQGTGYTSDALLNTVSNAPNKFSSENYGEYRYASVFARIGYNLRNRYILNVNARRDGSSNYGPDHQFGNFASIGGAWLFTEENWFKQHQSFLSFGKLRGSYGIAGSDGGIPYGYITRWGVPTASTPYNGSLPIVATQHANPDYRWQQNKKLEAAIDMGFFKDWITVSVAYYRNRTGNQLLSYPTPVFSGFASVIDNLNALVQNAGWEFTIGGKGIGIHSKNFNWEWAPRFTFSINQNKFVSFDGLGSSPFRNSGRIGHPLNGRYVLHFLGVDPQTGTYMFEDKNHDGVINGNYGPAGDVYYKKTSPSFSTGFGFNFEIKKISIALFFILKKQEGVNALRQANNPGSFNTNQPVEALGRWQKPGDITDIGKFSTVNAQDPSSNLVRSDLGYTDASYMRLQNLSLSYSLPDNISKKAGFQCSIFLNANNIFTITKYKGIDPETQNFGSMPPAKTVVAGLSFNF